MLRLDMNTALGRAISQMGYREDAGETALFSQQLLYVFTKTYDIEYPALKARTLIPVNYEVGQGAETHRYYQFDSKGVAKLIDNYATDFPSAEVQGVQFASNVVGLGSSYQYSIQDLRAASMAKIDISAKKATAARGLIETRLDILAALGDSATKIDGFLKDRAGTRVGSAVTKGSQASGTTWTTATNDEILADLLALTKSVFVNTKGIHTANQLLLGTAGYTKIAYNRFNTFSDKSIMQYALENIPGLQAITHWPRLDTAGASSKETIVAYDRNPDVLELIIPQEFEQFPPQPEGLAFKINCHMRCGGVSVRYPLGISYMDGTQP